MFAVFAKERLNVFFHLCHRFDIETCKNCECDYLQSSSSYAYLQYGGKNCGQWSANFLSYLIQVGSGKSDSESSTSMYVRFVSDDTVHGKGFNLSYVAGSSYGKCCIRAKWPIRGALNHTILYKPSISQA